MKLTLALVAFTLVSGACLASDVPELLPIPREPLPAFVEEGWFEGGMASRANLETMRLADHPQEGFERWVLDFSSVGSRVVGATAPHFQLHYDRGRSVTTPTGETVFSKPPRFLLLFEAVQDNFLSEASLRRLAKKSRFVKRIDVYPPIEKGDLAIELHLKDRVRFAAHQPTNREGRLVLDLKAVPSSSTLP